MGYDLSAVRVETEAELAQGQRFYVLKINADDPDAPPTLLRSGMYEGVARRRLSRGRAALTTPTKLPLINVLWDGQDEVAMHPQYNLGLGPTSVYICVISLEGIDYIDGRDFKQRNAFDPSTTEQA